MKEHQDFQCVECGVFFSEEDGIEINYTTILCPNCGRANFVERLDMEGFHIEDTEELEEPLIEGYLSAGMEEDEDSDYEGLYGKIKAGKNAQKIKLSEKEYDILLANEHRKEIGYYEERAKYKPRARKKKRIRDYFRDDEEIVKF